MSSDKTLNVVNSVAAPFCIKIRIEGKEGVKTLRIPYIVGKESYDSLHETVLKRYMKPSDDNSTSSIAADEYKIQFTDVSDVEWPVDIENTEDLDIAINASLANTFVKMVAKIYLKSEPPPAFTSPAAFRDADMMNIINPPTIIESSPVTTAGSKRKASPVKKKQTPTKRSKTTGSGDKRPVRARIIGSIAELHALGQTNVPKVQVAIFAGYSNAASKGFSNPLSSLKTEGIIEYPDKKSVALTDKGLDTEEAKTVNPPTSNEEVHNRIKALLTPKQQEIFDILAADGAPRLREDVAAAVGYTNPASKGYSNSVGKMSSLGLVKYPKDDADPKKKLVQLTSLCFPFTKVDPEAVAYRAPTPPAIDSL